MRSSWTALPFAAALFIAASVTANAGPLQDAVATRVTQPLASVQNFKDSCRGTNAEQAFCVGYLMGVEVSVDVFVDQPGYCAPSSDISARQLLHVFLTWADDNPTEWHKTPLVGIVSALVDAFTCVTQ